LIEIVIFKKKHAELFIPCRNESVIRRKWRKNTAGR